MASYLLLFCVFISFSDCILASNSTRNIRSAKAQDSPEFKPIDAQPSCAGNLTYCDTITDYPQSYIDSVENLVTELSPLFGVEEEPSNVIKNRQDSSNENELCTAIVSLVYPKVAQSIEGIWQFVVNHGKYRQGVRVEVCQKKGGEEKCLFSESFPIGYRSVCVQKYVYKRLVGLNKEGKPDVTNFAIPSCCTCSAVSTGASA